MSNQPEQANLWQAVNEGSARFERFIERLFSAAQPTNVFSPPQLNGDYMVITASELIAGGGMGYGVGGDSATEEAPAQPKGGSGGGGGGFSTGRPVAVISVNARGVQVEPVVDVTKLGLAFFTMLGSAVFMLLRMRRD